MRILSKPTKVMMVVPGSSTPHFRLLFNTDEGDFTIDEIAKKIGMTVGGVRHRIKKYGYASPRIFDPPEPAGWTAKRRKEIGENTPNSLFMRLSKKDRSSNLSKLPRLGSWERVAYMEEYD